MARDLASRVDLSTLVGELEFARTAGCAQGGFESQWFYDVVDLLAEITTLEGVPSSERKRICIDAIFAAAKRGEITQERLQSELGKLQQAFMLLPGKRFSVVTTIVVKDLPEWRIRHLGGWTIRLYLRLPGRYDRTFLSEIAVDHSLKEMLKAEEGYSWVVASGTARSFLEAFEFGVEGIDRLRGIWNYLLSRNVWGSFGGDSTLPVNRLLLGPLFTVHSQSGQAVGGTLGAEYWSDRLHALSAAERLGARKWQAVVVDERSVRSRMRGRPYGRELETLLLRYCRALDSRDPWKALIQLWGVLEVLTSTAETTNYTLTVRRAASIWDQPELPAAVLELLRFQRNRSAHAGIEDADGRIALLRLHRFVAGFIHFLLTSQPFASLAEVAELLDSPQDNEVIQARLHLLRRAMRFRGFSRRRSTATP